MELYRIGDLVIVDGLLPFRLKKIYRKIGIVISVNHYKAYPIALLIGNSIFQLPAEDLKKLC